MSTVPDYMSMYHLRPAEGVRCPGTGVTDGCESACGSWTSNLAFFRRAAHAINHWTIFLVWGGYYL